ncbi:MAG: DUF1080 domain-containing protein, partial [Rhodothermales bacterium]
MTDPLKSWVLLLAMGFVLAFQQATGQPVENGPWQSLFNGEDLSGWTERNGDHIFEARDGQIVGTTVPGQPNGFLTTDETFGDFILELEVNVDVLMNNSGIQFRSLSHAGYRDFRVHGYQAEIDTKPQRWSGSIYDEARRGWLYVTELNPASKSAFVNNTWNHYRIEAIGTTNRVWVNGIPTAHLIDDETTRGFIGLQLHANNPDDPPGSHQIRFRNIRIQTQNLRPSPLDDLFVVNLIPNHLSAQERAQGFTLLWDGQDTGGWSGADGASFAETGWVAVDGELRTSPASSDALSARHGFDAFELKFDFRPLEEGAVCGIRYRSHDPADDDGVGDVPVTSPYCRMASQKIDREAWNQGFIRVRPDRRVEYWLNGHLILEY